MSTKKSRSCGCGCDSCSGKKSKGSAYRCENCGTIHEGDHAPESCMKCDGTEFKKCSR